MNKAQWRQVARFGLVGGINTLFGYALFALLVWAGTPYPVAIAVATVAGVLFNFQTSGRLVFAGAPPGRFLRFLAVYCAVYVLNVAGVALLARLVGGNVYIANALVVPPLAVLAYVLQRNYVFAPS